MRALASALGILVAAYLLGAFTMWSLNPGDWSVYARFLTGAVGLFLALMFAVIVAEQS